MPTWLLVLALLLVLLLGTSIRIASDYQRYALFKFGRFIGFKGPGLVLKSPGAESNWVLLSVGDRGELVAPEVGYFKKVQLPVDIDKAVRPGSAIRIVGFSTDSLQAMLDSNQSRTVVCEKCGHKMTV